MVGVWFPMTMLHACCRCRTRRTRARMTRITLLMTPTRASTSTSSCSEHQTRHGRFICDGGFDIDKFLRMYSCSIQQIRHGIGIPLYPTCASSRTIVRFWQKFWQWTWSGFVMTALIWIGLYSKLCMRCTVGQTTNKTASAGKTASSMSFHQVLKQWVWKVSSMLHLSGFSCVHSDHCGLMWIGRNSCDQDTLTVTDVYRTGLMSMGQDWCLYHRTDVYRTRLMSIGRDWCL